MGQITLANPHWEALTPETHQAFEIEDLFEVAATKYARVRTFAVSATRALACFEDAEAQPMPTMIDRTPWTTMKRFLEGQAMAAG